MVPKVLLEVFDKIFNARFLNQTNVGKYFKKR